MRSYGASFFGFGAAAMALELIPFVGPWVFFASNACGAACLAEQLFLDKFEDSMRDQLT